MTRVQRVTYTKIVFVATFSLCVAALLFIAVAIFLEALHDAREKDKRGKG